MILLTVIYSQDEQYHAKISEVYHSDIDPLDRTTSTIIRIPFRRIDRSSATRHCYLPIGGTLLGIRAHSNLRHFCRYYRSRAPVGLQQRHVPI